MLGPFITLFFAFCVAGFGRLLYGRWTESLDECSKWGVSGILGLGTVGLLTLPIGLLQSGLRWGMAVVWLLALAGLAKLIQVKFWRQKLLARKPNGPEWLFVLAIALGALFALVADLTPSGAQDWDTIAYHLAVPKLWLEAGQIRPILFIHHSNFPLSVDNLYIWGLSWGDQFGAKAFQLCFYLFGVLCVFGLARRRYGSRAGAWAALTFATVPAVVWEAGTGYIDVAHGLYTGVGVVLALIAMFPGPWEGEGEKGKGEMFSSKEAALGTEFEQQGASSAESTQDPKSKIQNSEVIQNPKSKIQNSDAIQNPKCKIQNPVWPLAALCLGFAAGSKYTGLQAFIAVAVVFGGYSLIKAAGKGVGRLAAIIGVACAVCGVWYVKNEVWVGNPVFPFFYEVFGGKNWSQYNADIYRNQQQTFGVPRTGPVGGLPNFPDAVLGLAFQPGRYTDPQPQLAVTGGHASGALGFPWQASGFAIIASGLIWLFSGRVRRFEGLLLGWIGFSLLMWFMLSQQSRYALSFAPILAILLGGGVARLRAGPWLALAAGVQASASLGMLYYSQFKDDLQIVTGKVSTEAYLRQVDASYPVAEWLNENVKNGKVALYDDVLGFYYEIPYFWANPGHTTLIGYDKLNDGAEYVARMKQLGFTHIYICNGYGSYSPEQIGRIRGACGLDGPTVPYTETEKAALVADPGQKYKWLIADAAAKGLVTVAQDFRGPRGFVLAIK